MMILQLVTVSIIYVMLIYIVSQKKIKIILEPTSKSNLEPKFTYSLQRKKLPVKHN